MLLGVKAVIAESYERIHRSNLVNMGVLQFKTAENATTIGPSGREVFSLAGAGRAPHAARRRDRCRARGRRQHQNLHRDCTHRYAGGFVAFSHGGILRYVLRQLVKKSIS